MRPEEAREGWGRQPLLVTNGAGGGEGWGMQPLFVTAVTKMCFHLLVSGRESGWAEGGQSGETWLWGAEWKGAGGGDVSNLDPLVRKAKHFLPQQSSFKAHVLTILSFPLHRF